MSRTEPSSGTVGQPVERWTIWLSPALVAVALLGVLLVPLLIDRRAEVMRQELAEVTGPARDLIDAAQFALAQQVAAKRGYLLTGDRTYLRSYEQAHQDWLSTRAELQPLITRLGPEVRRRFADLDTATTRWVDANAILLRADYSDDRALRSLALNQQLYEQATVAAVRAGDAIGAETRERLAEIRSVQRFGLYAGALLTVLALIAAGSVVWIGHRARLLALENRQRARTEGQLRRRAEQALRARDEILAVVSHDLRNPLGTIMLTTELLTTVPLEDADRRAKLDIIRRTAARMSRLIEDLLDAARIEAGRAVVVHPKPYSTRALVTELVEMFRPQTEGKGQVLTSRLPADIDSVLIDRDRAHQALANILGNAVKFTPQGGRIEVGADCLDDRIRITIADTGPGIPPAALDRIFDPFWQDPTTAKLGTGLGLAIARGIVEAHGGSIDVESTPGVGTRFHVEFRAAVAVRAAD